MPVKRTSTAALRKRKQRAGEIAGQASDSLIADWDHIAKTLSTAPAEVQRISKRPPISVKDAGTQFVGRSADVEGIVERVTGVIRQTKSGAALPATVITGASGVGKSTLLRRVQDTLIQKKVPVLKLKAQQLESEATFAKAVRDATEGLLRSKLMKAKRIAGEVGTRTVDLTVEFAAHLLHAAGRVSNVIPFDVSIPKVDIATATYKAWLEGKPTNVFATLQTIHYMYPKGMVLIIDEAQTLRRYRSVDGESTCAGHVINSLATADGRRDGRMERCTVLCAGLPDTVDVIDELGSFGTEPHPLSPLPAENVQELINACIDEGAKGNAKLARKARELWANKLTDMYGDWTRHAAAAAQSAKLALLKWKDDALTQDWGWPAVVTMADKLRARVYQKVIDNADEHQIPDNLRDTIVHGLQCNDKQFTKDQLARLIRVTMQQEWSEYGYSADQHKDQTAALIQSCKHCGLLDLAKEHTGDIEKDNYFCPIPSLLNHLGTLSKTPQDRIDHYLDQAELSSSLPPS